MIYILILIAATSDSIHAGAGSVNQEFSSKERCISAGKSLSANLTIRNNYVLTWGCYPK